MSLPTQILPAHHRHCDDLFVAAEESAQRGDWAAAAPAFARFYDQMKAHFEAEEGLLFPAFEAATGHAAVAPASAPPLAGTAGLRAPAGE